MCRRSVAEFWMSRLIFVILLSAYAGTSGLNAEEVSPPSADTLLKHYTDWLNSCSAAEYSFSETSTWSKLSGEKIAGQQWLSAGLARFDRPNESFFVADQESHDGGDVSETQSVMRRGSAFQQVESNGDDYWAVSYLDPAKYPYDDSRVAGHAGNSILIFGFFSMGKKYILHRIDESFRKMTVNVDKQTWQGHEVYRLIGSDNKDSYELWLVPTLNFMPCRIVHSCDKQIDRNADDFFSFGFLVESYTQVGSISVPQKYRIDIESSYREYVKGELQSAIPAKELVQGEIAKVSLGRLFSDNDFKITMPIPNYTEVSMQDALKTKYVWYNGKIVQWTDELANARLREGKSIPGIGELRFWLIAAGILMITLGIAGKLWTYIKNRNNKKRK